MKTSARTSRVCPRIRIAAATIAAAVPFPVLAEAPPLPTAYPMTRIDEVVVTAPRTVAPMTVETDPKAPRQPVPPNDGAGYLKNIPGFSMIRKGGTGGDPVLRGQAGSRLNILFDDTPLHGGCGQRMDPATSYVFPESYDRITVLKGPQSVVHGGSAQGGTILFDRKTERFTELGYRGNASVLLGSFGRNDQMLDVAGGDTFGYLRAIGTHAQSDDYHDGSGRQVHSNYARESGTAILGLTPDPDTTLEVSTDVSEGQAAYGDRAMDGIAFDRESVKIRAVRTNLSTLISEVKLVGYYDRIDHVMDRFTLRPFTVMGGVMPMAALNNPDRTTLGTRTSATLTPWSGTEITIGFDFTHDEHRSRNLSQAEFLAGRDYRSKARVPDLTFNHLSGYVEASRELGDQSRVLGGYRLTAVETVFESLAGTPIQDTLLHNGFGRFEQDLDLTVPVTAYLGLGFTMRAPDYWERTRSGSVRPELLPLKPEKTTQVDLGVLHESEEVRASLSLFYSRTDDYILMSATQGRNIDASTVGGEAELSYRFLPSWTVDASLAYTYGTNLSDDRPLAQMPPLEGSVGLRYDDGKFQGGVLARFVADQNRFDAGWGNVVGQDIGPTGGFAVFSANLGWKPAEDAQIAVGIDNILDKTYAEHLSRAGTGTLNAAGYQQTVRVNEPGRTFWVKGSVKF